MRNSHLEIKTAIQIQKPVDEVFEAIVDPEKMKNFFISEGSGRMEEGNELIWKFPEFEGEVPVKVGSVEQDRYISFYWDVDYGLLVEITLSTGENSSTIVVITEKSKPNDEAGISWLKGNTEGWANFLACLKAYLEYGINLRKGAFEFRRGEY